MRTTDTEAVPVVHREPLLRAFGGAHAELVAKSIVRHTTDENEPGAGRVARLPDEPRWCR